MPSITLGVPSGARRATTIAARALVTSWNSANRGSDPTDGYAALEGGMDGSVSVGRGPTSPTIMPMTSRVPGLWARGGLL